MRHLSWEVLVTQAVDGTLGLEERRDFQQFIREDPHRGAEYRDMLAVRQELEALRERVQSNAPRLMRPKAGIGAAHLMLAGMGLLLVLDVWVATMAPFNGILRIGALALLGGATLLTGFLGVQRFRGLPT